MLLFDEGLMDLDSVQINHALSEQLHGTARARIRGRVRIKQRFTANPPLLAIGAHDVHIRAGGEGGAALFLQRPSSRQILTTNSYSNACTCTECGIYASLASVLFRYTVHVIGVDSLELAHVTGAAESSETFRKFEFEKRAVSLATLSPSLGGTKARRIQEQPLLGAVLLLSEEQNSELILPTKQQSKDPSSQPNPSKPFH